VGQVVQLTRREARLRPAVAKHCDGFFRGLEADMKLSSLGSGGEKKIVIKTRLPLSYSGDLSR
jgi:hypothetical protein